MIRFMKRNYKILVLVLLLAFASCSFTTKTFEDPDKDKLLIQVITYVLQRGHFDPKEINDDFSAEVFADYLDQLDPLKGISINRILKNLKPLNSNWTIS